MQVLIPPQPDKAVRVRDRTTNHPRAGVISRPAGLVLTGSDDVFVIRTVRRQRTRTDGMAEARYRGRPRRWAVSTMSAVLCTSIALAPSAHADSADDFRSAVIASRAASSCGPLQSHPLVEQATDIINRTTDVYLAQAARAVPTFEPLPVLKDLDYPGSKAKLMLGAAKNVGDAIKGAVLQGYSTFPDCTYADFGVSTRFNDATGFYLAALVVAGP